MPFGSHGSHFGSQPARHVICLEPELRRAHPFAHSQSCPMIKGLETTIILAKYSNEHIFLNRDDVLREIYDFLLLN